MRQTQRTAPAVVALLLALGADARISLKKPQSPNNAPFPDAVSGTLKWGLANGNSMFQHIDGTTFTTHAAWSDAKEGSCIDCLRSGQTWCSRHYMAEKTASAYAISTSASATNNTPTVGTPSVTTSATVDLGACCFDNGRMDTVGLTAAVGTSYANKVTCPAMYTNEGGTLVGKTGTAGTAGDAAAYAKLSKSGTVTHYWCSDGAIAKASTTLHDNVITAAATVANTAAVNPNDTTGVADPRTEFWMINCRQRQDVCGGAALIATPAVGTYVDRTILATSGMVYTEKCTWVLKTNGKGAPTFKTAKGASTNTSIMGDKYDLHYVEYSLQGTDATALANMIGSETLGISTMGSSSLPIMSAATGFSTLKGRLYDRAQYLGYIEQPLVWVWADQTKLATSTDPLYYKKRWFPPTVAEKAITDFGGLKTTYDTNRGSFDTLKAAYETAMTPVASDFFADLFNPPAKVTPPLRPAMPTPLAAYGGYRMAVYANTSAYLFDDANLTTKLQSVTATEFVVDGDYGGGWGSFTMGLLNIEEGMGKSFGVFGYSKTSGEAGSFSQMAKHMCAAANVGTDGFCSSVTDSLSYQVLVVSLWANHPDAPAASGTVGMKISFTQTAWATKKTAWGLPAQPTAAVDSKTSFGAQALAASAVAAVAVASALY